MELFRLYGRRAGPAGDDKIKGWVIVAVCGRVGELRGGRRPRCRHRRGSSARRLKDRGECWCLVARPHLPARACEGRIGIELVILCVRTIGTSCASLRNTCTPPNLTPPNPTLPHPHPTYPPTPRLHPNPTLTLAASPPLPHPIPTTPALTLTVPHPDPIPTLTTPPPITSTPTPSSPPPHLHPTPPPTSLHSHPTPPSP